MTARFALKAATDDLHRELDDRLSRFDLKQRGDYAQFLDFHARLVPPMEDALSGGGMDDVVEGWSQSRRSSALESDLAALDRPMPDTVRVAPLTNQASVLGTAYVLEGSRLGAKVLAKQVDPAFPAAFLRTEGGAGPWPDVVAALDRCLYSDDLVGEATLAARQCFALFLSVAHEARI